MWKISGWERMREFKNLANIFLILLIILTNLKFNVLGKILQY